MLIITGMYITFCSVGHKTSILFRFINCVYISFCFGKIFLNMCLKSAFHQSSWYIFEFQSTVKTEFPCNDESYFIGCLGGSCLWDALSYIHVFSVSPLAMTDLKLRYSFNRLISAQVHFHHLTNHVRQIGHSRFQV